MTNPPFSAWQFRLRLRARHFNGEKHGTPPYSHRIVSSRTIYIAGILLASSSHHSATSRKSFERQDPCPKDSSLSILVSDRARLVRQYARGPSISSAGRAFFKVRALSLPLISPFGYPPFLSRVSCAASFKVEDCTIPQTLHLPTTRFQRRNKDAFRSRTALFACGEEGIGS